ncbi:forkhead box protein P2-like [Neodiprion lecontei]|uniref:Forkhead box protein P2-like n=1 Tax=Neodiprion lecontei TaxID=441921 RepID=A0ABM3GIB5_NEOLC|nr:forkhead box protein P2-like [Neodiprion lecontei]
MSNSRLTRSRRRESGGEEPFVMENPRVPETIPSPSVDPRPIPSTISQIDLLKIMSQQQEAAERQQQQLLQLFLDQLEQRKREQEQRKRELASQLEQRKREQEQRERELASQLEQRKREQEQREREIASQLEQRRLDREAQERSETSLHELFRTTVAALQAVHQVNGSGEPAVTPRGSRVVTPLPSSVPSSVPVPAVRQVQHPGQFQDVRDSRSAPFIRGIDESPIGRVTVNNEIMNASLIRLQNITSGTPP